MPNSPLLFTADDLFNSRLVTVQEATTASRESSTGAKKVVTLGTTQLLSPNVAKEFFMICIEHGSYDIDEVMANNLSYHHADCTIRICMTFNNPDGHGTISSHYVFKGTTGSLKAILDYIRQNQLWDFA